jgi:ABC-type transport system involved in cytochrome c biogenesis permease component
MKHHHRMLVLAFFLPLVAIGLPYLQAPYNTLQLPDAWLGWPLVLVFFAAVASRLSGAGFLVAWLVAGVTMPLIVLVDVAMDTAKDPDTHGMWPFALLIACALGFGIALLGALAGHFAIKQRTPPTSNG